MPGNVLAISIPPAGFKPDDAGKMVNPATGQTANWDPKQGAWVDGATGKTIPRRENISAAPPTETTPPATDDPCESLRQAAAWARGLERAYKQELGHSDSVVESELVNIADLSREIKDLISKDKDLAQLAGESTVAALSAAAGVSVGVSAAAGTPVFAATGEVVGYIATSTLGLAVALPLAGALIGTSLGLAVRNIWDAADRKADFKKALDMLDRARGRMGYFLEHAAGLRAAAVEAQTRADAATRAYNDCADTPDAKKDPCRYERAEAAEQDGYVEGLRRTLEAVRASLSAATDAQARAEASAAGASGDQAAVQRSTASYEGGIVRATTLEQGRLERLIKEANEEQGKRRKAIKDCGEKQTTAPGSTPVIGGGGPGGPKAPVGLGQLGLWAVLFVIAAGVLGLGGVILLNNRPTETPKPTATATSSTLPTAVPTAAPTLVDVSPRPSATPPVAVIFAPFEVVSDSTISHCEHIYDVRFTIQDSNGQSAVYAGQIATFQLLDGEGPAREAEVGSDGTFVASVDETFQKTGSGCFSKLKPQVYTVGGQSVFGS